MTRGEPDDGYRDLPPAGLVNGRAPLLSLMRRRAKMRDRICFLLSLHSLTQGMIDEHNQLVDVLTGTVPR